MNTFIAIMAAPLVTCLLLVLINSSLGLHVLGRGVIFVDLALAQIAALGQSVAFLMGAEPRDPATYLWSIGFTLLGAALFSFLWDRTQSVFQEAFIGITFSLATAAALLLLANAPHGAEHVSGMLSGGGLLWTDWMDVGIMAAIYSFAGLFLFLNLETLALCSFNPQKAARMGINVRLWDFLFYACFGIVVTESVRAAGVLAVFSFLIVPVVCASLLGKTGRNKLHWAWGIGAIVSVTGSIVSYWRDLPPGATIVCIFGLVVLGISMILRIQRGASHRHAAHKVVRHQE